MHINLSKLQEIVEDRGGWLAAVHGGHKEFDMIYLTEQQVSLLFKSFGFEASLT